MSPLPRPKPSPGVLVRALVSLGAVWAMAAALAAYVAGRAVPGPGFGAEFATLVVIGALARRYGVALPGNGFSSYILGVTAFAVLDRGWACAVLVGPTAMVAGDLMLRRLPPRAALVNAAHLTAGTAVVGLMYDRLGGVAGPDALDPANLGPLVALLALLPVVVNATFYLELALGRSLAWVDAWLTARWETIVYACSIALALAWLRLVHAGLGPLETLVVGAALAAATATSVYVVRLGVRADELALIQGLSQAIARDISLAKSFGRIQELTRRLVPWEQMGFARYDAHTNEMELVADTAAGGRTSFRFDANAGLTGEAVRLRRPVVAHALRPDQVVVPGAERPGAEVLVPLYHAGQLVGLWSVRHSDPLMYRETDGEVLALLAPQLALMLAIEASVQPVVGASERTTSYRETLTATTQQSHASSQSAAAGAAVHGRGFAEVAGEVPRLAEASGREARAVGKSAQDTRGALDQAAQLLERVREDLTEVVQGSSAWVADLSQLAAAATGTARAGKRVAELARGIADLSGRIGTSLGQARVGAQASAAEAEAVAAAATEQLKAIAELTHGATELTQLADNLAKAVRFVRGENGHP